MSLVFVTFIFILKKIAFAKHKQCHLLNEKYLRKSRIKNYKNSNIKKLW